MWSLRLWSHRSRLFGYTVYVFEGTRILEIKHYDFLIPGHIGGHYTLYENRTGSIPTIHVLYYTILYYTILYYTILYYTILYYTILYYTTLHYTTLHYTTLHYTTLHYTTLYYTILHVYAPIRAYTNFSNSVLLCDLV